MNDKLINTGDKAPDFAVPNQDGRETSLRDFKNKWLVLYFYPKDNTSGCTKQGIEFTQKLADFQKLDCAIVGVSADTPACHRDFIRDQKLKITLLSDEQHKLLEAYGVWQTKQNYGKEYLGIVRSTFLINPKGVVTHVWRNVKVDGHVEEVLCTLRDSQS